MISDRAISIIEQRLVDNNLTNFLVYVNEVWDEYTNGLYIIDKDKVDDDDIDFYLEDGDNSVLVYDQFPSNCGIGLFRDIYVNHLPQIVLDILVETMDIIALDDSRSMMMYTTSEEQSTLEESLKIHGWKQVAETFNRNSQNKITVWIKEVKK